MLLLNACRQLTKDTVTSAFLQAATYGWPDIVQLLVAKGGEVQHAEDAALRTACAYGHGDVVKVLLSSGEQHPGHTCSTVTSSTQQGGQLAAVASTTVVCRSSSGGTACTSAKLARS